ncbi:hypothetical protein HDU99_007419, partial [Rhizoclosmatium hyalinum]
MERFKTRPSIVTVSILSTGYANENNWEKVHEIHETWCASGNVTPDAVYYNGLLRVAAGQGNVAQVKRLSMLMQERGFPETVLSLSYRIRALVWDHRGQYPDMRLVQEAVDVLDMVEGLKNDDVLRKEEAVLPFVHIMNAFAKLNAPEECQKLVLRFQSGIGSFATGTRRHPGLSTLHKTYIQNLVSCGRWKDAKVHLAKNLTFLKPADHHSVIYTLIKNGSPKDLVSPPIIKKINSCREIALKEPLTLDPDILGAYLATCIKHNENQHAIEAWNARMAASAKKSDNFRIPHKVFAVVITACETAKTANDWFTRFIETDPTVTTDILVSSALLSVVANDPTTTWKDVSSLLTEIRVRTNIAPSSNEWETMSLILVSKAARAGDVKATEHFLKQYQLEAG